MEAVPSPDLGGSPSSAADADSLAASFLESPHLNPGRRDASPKKRHPAVKPVSARQVGFFALALVAAAVALLVDMGFGDEDYKGDQPAQRCAALVLFVAVLWATDAFPAYLVALSVPLLAVTMRVMCVPRHLRFRWEHDTLLVPASYCNSTDPKPGHPMYASQAAVVSVGSFFNPVILLFMTGFVMAVVLDKFKISKRIADKLVVVAGRRPTMRLAFVMALCILMSSVLNNVPAAVLGASLMAPSFKGTLRSSWPKYSLLGVAYSCNIGGMVSPIASPQNVIAVIALSTATRGQMQLSFVNWFAVAVPFCTVSTVTVWLYLRWFYGAKLPPLMPEDDADDLMNMPREARGPSAAMYSSMGNVTADRRPHGDRRGGEDTDGGDDPGSSAGESADNSPLLLARKSSAADESDDAGGISARDVIICGTIVVTVGLWVAFDAVSSVFGSMGLVALIPILLFGALGYLTKEDFNSLSWDTLMLLGGGLSLGTAVDSSGLLLVIGDRMESLLHGASPFVVLLAFSSLVAILANFISSTVSAVLLLPVVATVGVSIGHGRMMVLLCVLMTSGAMGLPVSSFPNANTMAQRYQKLSLVDNSDFIKTGFPISALILVLINTLGYGLCSLYGF